MPDSLIVGEPVCVVPIGDLCGEGAVWHPSEQAVYWTDINGFRIHRWDFASQAVHTWSLDEPVTALNLTTRDDLLVAAFASRVALWHPSYGRIVHWRRLFAEHDLREWPEVRCNDARVDPAGRLWVATMQNNVGRTGEPLPVDRHEGRLFSLDAAGETKIWRAGLGIGNTVAWSPDGRYLYTADTLADEICRFAWNDDGSIGDGGVWFGANGSEGRGLPDGSAMDAEGYLWNCRHGAGCLLRISPAGQVDRVVQIPVKNPTTCVFGGPEERTLFVTSAKIDDEESPLSGGLFAIETNVRGLAANRFQLLLETT